MANKKITDLMSGTPTRDSLLESAIDISGTMDSRKVTTGAIADLASANVAAPYNPATTYAIGQYCLYKGNIYRCIAITTGTFDATKWTQIVVTGEFRRVVELTTAQYEALSSAEQNNGTLYIITDGIPPSETVTGSDIIPFIDVSDSNKPKSTTAAAVAGLFNGCSFSESEMLIGTWINGKPLYKKVIKLLNKTIPSGSITESLSSLSATLAFFDHCIMKDNYGNYVALPYVSNTANSEISCYISANFSTLHITYGSYWQNKVCDFYITILYTKT